MNFSVESVLPLDVSMKIGMMFSETASRMKNSLVLVRIAKLSHRHELKIFIHSQNHFYASSNQTVLDANLLTGRNNQEKFLIKELVLSISCTEDVLRGFLFCESHLKQGTRV